MITTTTRPILGMKQINKNTLQVVNSSGTTMQCNSNQFIFFSLTTLIEGFSSYPEVKLRFKSTTSDDGTIGLYKADANYLVSLTSYSIKMLTIDGSTWFEADITDAFVNDNKEAVYFAICLESGVSATIYNESSGTSNAPQLIVNKIEKTKNVKYQKHLSGSSSDSDLYNVNLRTGELTYSINLMNIESNHLPLNLMLNYDERNLTNSTVNGNISTKFPIGWRLNYQQFIYVSGNNYIYVDGNNIKHTFVLANNLDSSSTNKVYFDQDGTYLTLKINSESNFEIRTADENQILTFNSSGYLINIKQLVSNDYEYNVNLYYNSNNQLTSIEKSNGDKFTISYEPANKKIIIDSVGDKRAILLYDSDNLLTNVQLPNGSTTEFTYTKNDSSLLSRAVVPIIPSLPELPEILENRLATIVTNKKKIKFSYLNNIESIKEIRELYFDEENEYPEVHYSLTYSKHQTTVKMTPNSNGTSNSGRLTNVFTFNEEGELIREHELEGTTEKTSKIYKREKGLNYEYSDAGIYLSEDVTYLVCSNETIDKTIDLTPDLEGQELFKREYQIFINYKVNQIGCENNSNTYIATIKLYLDDKLEKTINIDTNTKFSNQVMIPLTTKKNEVKLKFKNTNPNVSITFTKFKLFTNTISDKKIKIQKTEEQDDSLEVTEYSELKLTYGDSEVELSGIQCSINDLIINKDNYFKAINNNLTKYNIWYNEGKNFLSNVNNVKYVRNIGGLVVPIYEKTPIGDLRIVQFSEDVCNKYYEYDKNDLVGSKQIIKTTESKIFANSTETRKTRVDYFGNILSEVDENESEKQYTYNSEKNISKIEIINGENKTATNFSYQKDRLYKKTQYYNGELIGELISMNMDGEVINEYNIDDLSINKKYEYSLNKISNIKFSPFDDYLYFNFNYENENLSKLNIVDYNSSDNTTESQEYYNFIYDEKNNLKEIKLFGSTFCTINTSFNNGLKEETITYNNGEQIKKVFDKYGNVVKVEKIQNETNETLIELFYTNEPFNYYSSGEILTNENVNQGSKIQKIILENDNSIRYTYDNYGRLIRKEIHDNSFEGDYSSGYTGLALLYNYNNTEEWSYLKSFSSKTTSYYLIDDGLVNITRLEGINDERNTPASAVRTSIPTIVNNQITYLNFEITTVTDDLYRKYITTFQDNNLVFENKYQYASGNSTYSSNLVSKEQFIIGTNIGNEEPLLTKDIEYTYDNQGRVIQIVKNNFLTTYTYDKYNRLVREDKEFFDRTYVMEYDKYGNITSKKFYYYNNLDNLILEHVYNYDQENKMKLVSVTELSNGLERTLYEFEYNEKLQPTKYKNKELGWKNGRLNNYDDIYFNYSADGTRTQKGVFLEEYNNDGEMLFEKVTSYDSDNGNIYKENNGHTGKDLVFIEGTEGKAGFYYEGEAYFYRKNIFGDVIEIYKDGEAIVRYEYDAWGNHKVLNPDGSENKSSNFIGNINPIRYRGYYYDRETKLYYCNSRYYDPETGRWISMDSIEYLDPYTLNGVNLYVYCNNNPIMYSDESGHFPWLIFAGFIFVGATRAAANAIGQYQSGGDIDWFEVAVEGVYGGVIGALTVATAGTFSISNLYIRMGVTAVAMGLKDGLLMYNDTGDINKAGMAGLNGTLKGGLLGFASYVAFLPTNVTQWTFASGASIGIGFGYLSGLKDKDQKIRWPWMWESLSY